MSFLGAAAGAVGGGISSIISGALNNSAARHAATVANQRNVYNYQHRYQWSMDDMQKAGLNPILAATQGVGGSINGASALAANYDIASGVVGGIQAQAAGNSAKAANRQAGVSEKLGDEQVKNLAAQTILAGSSAKKFDAETYGLSLANKLASDSYADNLALVKQNLENAKKQGEFIDSQKASQQYLMNVVYPAQATMMYAQGNAANSSAAYNAQLSNVASADYLYKTSRNADYKRTGMSDDGGLWSTLGRVATRWIDNVGSKYYYKNGGSY